MINSKTKWLTRTSLMIALLIVLQFVTKAFGQLVTGSCVNAVLAFSALSSGIYSGLVVAVLSPFFAFLLGIGPQFFPLTPAIAAANCVFVLVLHLLCRNKSGTMPKILACIASAFLKFLTLNVLIVQLLCRILELPDKQVTMFTTMFSWPQFITALIGSAIALIIVSRIRGSAK